MRMENTVFTVNSPTFTAQRRKAICIFDESEKRSFLTAGRIQIDEEHKENYNFVPGQLETQLRK